MTAFKTRFMRVFFYLLYHPFAWTYDLVAAIVSLGLWKKWVLSVIPELIGPRVLELGHGPGHLQVELAANQINSFGVDESRQMGVIASRRLLRSQSTTNLATAYAQSLPFPNLSFDQAVATFPSEYIFNPQTISEIYRVLFPGGKLIILPSAWISGRNFIHRTAAWLFQVTDQAIPWNNDHLKPFISAGFKLQQKHIMGNSWSLVIIIAQK